MFKLKVSLDGVERVFDTLALSARDLEPALKRWGGYLKAKTKERFEAQDFAPLAPATIEKRMQKGVRNLERKLEKDVRRAVGRAVRGSPVSGVARALVADAAFQSKAVQRRVAVLEEFRRQHGRGAGLQDQAASMGLSFKQLLSLSQREQRALEQAVGAPILGKLARSPVVEVGGGSVSVIERTRTEWSEAHNKGDSVGHGARVPKRATLFVDHEDLDELAKILKEHHLLPLERLTT